MSTDCTHCELCRCCIESLQVHCRWLGKCIGKRNTKTYLTTLCLGGLLQSVYLILWLVGILLEIHPCRDSSNRSKSPPLIRYVCLRVCLYVLSMGLAGGASYASFKRLVKWGKAHKQGLSVHQYDIKRSALKEEKKLLRQNQIANIRNKSSGSPHNMAGSSRILQPPQVGVPVVAEAINGSESKKPKFIQKPPKSKEVAEVGFLCEDSQKPSDFKDKELGDFFCSKSKSKSRSPNTNKKKTRYEERKSSKGSMTDKINNAFDWKSSNMGSKQLEEPTKAPVSGFVRKPIPNNGNMTQFQPNPADKRQKIAEIKFRSLTNRNF